MVQAEAGRSPKIQGRQRQHAKHTVDSSEVVRVSRFLDVGPGT